MLNDKKTKNLFFGKKHEPATLRLDGKDIEWVKSWQYLGVHIRSHTSFNCDISEKVKSFYRCANGILRIEGRSSETVMLQLLETHCLSILTYAIDVIHVADRDERRKLRVAYNSIFRKVFNYRTWESVTDLQHSLQRPTWEELVDIRSKQFLNRVSHSDFRCLVSGFWVLSTVFLSVFHLVFCHILCTDALFIFCFCFTVFVFVQPATCAFMWINCIYKVNCWNLSR